MKVLAAMSGGVDSSVAAALTLEQGHEVVAVTMKLWDTPAEVGCCSVAEIDDARRVADQLGIDHWVFRFTDEFVTHVADPYAADHAAGRTPNPCIECNRHIKFGRLLQRARQLGFDAVATGHHARVVDDADTAIRRLLRGNDPRKDQSYVLWVLTQDQLARCLFPVGELTKTEVRTKAAALGLRTADKPDSQEVCFVAASGGRAAFLENRIDLHPGRVVDTAGTHLGHVDAIELVTVGQRRGLGVGGAGGRRYAVDIDIPTTTVTVGTTEELLVEQVTLTRPTWRHEPVTGAAEVQSSAHGQPLPADVDGDAGGAVVHFHTPQQRIARGQSVVLYRGDEVLGGGIAV